jgi:hypothetical protein
MKNLHNKKCKCKKQVWWCKNKKKQMDSIGFCCWKIVAIMMQEKEKEKTNVCDGDEVKHEHY